MRVNVSRSSGFSLAEMIVVLLVIATLASVAVPTLLAAVRDYQARGAAEGVASWLQTARVQAARRNSENGLVLSLNYLRPGDVYFGDRLKPNVKDRLNPTRSGSEIAPGGTTFRLPEGYEFVSSGEPRFNSFVFLSNGTVKAVAIGGARGSLIGFEDGNWVVKIRQRETDTVRTIQVNQNGRVVVL